MAEHLTFYLAACHYPPGVLERSRQVRSAIEPFSTNEVGPGERTLQRLAQERQKDQHGRCPLIFTGDLIYADATAGLFDPRQQDAPWDRAWDTRNDNPWLKFAIPPDSLIALIDDHEIVDNWEPSNNKARNADLRETMYRGRSRFFRRSSRGSHAHPGASPEDRRLWYPGDLDGHFLFVGDTRTERQARGPTQLVSSQIMSHCQFKALKDGLCSAQPDTWKLIATPSMLLPRPIFLADDTTPEAAVRCDSWCGYPASLRQILAHIADHAIQHCVFLSGDEHLPSLTNIDVQRIDAPGKAKVSLSSIHAGALYAPYPFANAAPADFLEADTFEFTLEARRYRCTVRTEFPPVRHEGYIRISLSSDASSSRVCFRDALDPSRDACYDNVIGQPIPG